MAITNSKKSIFTRKTTIRFKHLYFTSKMETSFFECSNLVLIYMNLTINSNVQYPVKYSFENYRMIDRRGSQKMVWKLLR